MSSELQRCGFVVQWPIKKQQNQLTIGTLRFLVNKKTYWCLAGNEGMIHFITINNHPSNPHSNPSIPYVKRTSKKKTRGFLFGLLNQLPHQTWEMLLQLSRMGWYHGLRSQPNYGRISSSRHLTIEHVINTIKNNVVKLQMWSIPAMCPERNKCLHWGYWIVILSKKGFQNSVKQMMLTVLSLKNSHC